MAGAMYAFPSVKLPPKAIEEQGELGTGRKQRLFFEPKKPVGKPCKSLVCWLVGVRTLGQISIVFWEKLGLLSTLGFREYVLLYFST